MWVRSESAVVGEAHEPGRERVAREPQLRLRLGSLPDPASLQAVRLQVYQRSQVKDIRLVNRDGSVICSAYSETLEFDSGWAERSDINPRFVAELYKLIHIESIRRQTEVLNK